MDASKKDLTLGDLFNGKKLIVPSYQRAYAWEEPQLMQFVSDIRLNIREKEYYYGHFILEENSDSDTFEIIDGQQRITTFILFLMICGSLGAKDTDKYIRKFETVSYDQEVFGKIQTNINETGEILNVEPQTLSAQRMLFALNYFRKLFNSGSKPELTLDTKQIDEYINVLTQAHISTHITDTKAVAVQIFELQNTRGVRLNLIEKVKSKLMKNVYLVGVSKENETKTIIEKIQDGFADIYRYEETASVRSFRGELNLEDILLHHLRIIDDGSKILSEDKNLFNSPSKTGNKEEAILSYIDKQIIGRQNAAEYITNLVAKFKVTVELVSSYLPKLDERNHLIGDVFILDKNLSLEFFILLYHKAFQINIENTEVVKLWERLLYTRDFHDKYYRQWYRDDFERMYSEVASLSGANKLEDVLKKYIKEGFRKELMENENLPKTVLNHIEYNKQNILNNAFNWWQEKMVYLLYKYEIEQQADLVKLRKIMKEGRSVEHMLPQEWQWEWIGEKDSNNLSDRGKIFREKTGTIINGIGNLLLITGSENSSQSNNHPKTKNYTSCSGGSYDLHNSNKEAWDNHDNWNQLIIDRGEKLFAFLKKFIC